MIALSTPRVPALAAAPSRKGSRIVIAAPATVRPTCAARLLSRRFLEIAFQSPITAWFI